VKTPLTTTTSKALQLKSEPSQAYWETAIPHTPPMSIQQRVNKPSPLIAAAATAPPSRRFQGRAERHDPKTAKQENCTSAPRRLRDPKTSYFRWNYEHRKLRNSFRNCQLQHSRLNSCWNPTSPIALKFANRQENQVHVTTNSLVNHIPRLGTYH